MGTDIHIIVEQRKGDHWELVDVPVYRGRNYVLFGVLANVRNGYGFAGVPTGAAVIPICEPRGLPDDIGVKVDDEYMYDEDTWLGDHSHSYLTVREILDYNWHVPKNQLGIVSVSEYKKFREAGVPESWCGGVAGPTIYHISNEEMDRRIRDNDWVPTESQLEKKAVYHSGGGAHGTPEFVTSVAWSTPLDECCDNFLEWVASLSTIDEPNNLRIVFGFDS